MKRLLSQYSYKYPAAMVYMLQSTEYQVKPYLAWYGRVGSFSSVMKRRTLEKTSAARMLRLGLTLGILLQVIAGVALFKYGQNEGSLILQVAGILLVLVYPQTWARLVVLPLWLGKTLITDPKHRKQIAASELIFRDHPAVKIAVLGSYGKTTMKELLHTVLSAEKNVAATPANKNVPVSHALFARKLTGDEDVLVIEYGEGAPGDIPRFAKVTHPSLAVITGLAPAHLDQYPTFEAAAEDLFSINQYVEPAEVYVNVEPLAVKPYVQSANIKYDRHNVGDWTISHIKVDIDGTSFELIHGSTHLKLKSGLIGAHQVGPLATVAVIAHQLGVSDKAIERGIAQTTAFEHRMQARPLHGGWILDDTYNGNIEGVKAGLEVLKTLQAKRKVYVTPGLVDQGVETEYVHIEMGKAIAAANPDKVVLMQNSATEHIQKGLHDGGYNGSVQLEADPLDFYTNIEHFIAAGDLVLMQNDWTDNYN
jgi:UDP-N-acetylmuramyl pentapeptide synthase